MTVTLKALVSAIALDLGPRPDNAGEATNAGGAGRGGG